LAVHEIAPLWVKKPELLEARLRRGCRARESIGGGGTVAENADPAVGGKWCSMAHKDRLGAALPAETRANDMPRYDP
jgi:hypothetical protein